MKWVNQLKIAIIENDASKIDMLVQNMPKFTTEEEMRSAAYLMQEAHTLLSAEKEKIASNLLKLKKQKTFLASASAHNSSFDQSH